MQPFDTQLVVDLMFEFYNTLFKFPFFLPTSSLIYPPHQFSEQEIRKHAPDMDPVVLDLIKRLPYLRDTHIGGGQTIGPGMQSYNLQYCIGFAQNPLELEGDLKEEAGLYVNRWSVTLSEGRFGRYMVLNTRTGTITEVDWAASNEPESFPPYYFGHQPTSPAEDVLRKWIRRYMTLEWIPWRDLSGNQCILKMDGFEEEKDHYRGVKDMYLKYGWPDNLQQEKLEDALKAYERQGVEERQAIDNARTAERDRVRLNVK